ncbi:unnamed protein product [Caenorhabditis bovis]|uniref:Uncharacterized protein n=1 Tax=Caenorhabditis bovis TaxID=2654633 RepID=A0A8S1F3V4_9PELO|nr:unnamed protein product [Caenorhabditis bovis]
MSSPAFSVFRSPQLIGDETPPGPSSNRQLLKRKLDEASLTPTGLPDGLQHAPYVKRVRSRLYTPLDFDRELSPTHPVPDGVTISPVKVPNLPVPNLKFLDSANEAAAEAAVDKLTEMPALRPTTPRRSLVFPPRNVFGVWTPKTPTKIRKSPIFHKSAEKETPIRSTPRRRSEGFTAMEMEELGPLAPRRPSIVNAKGIRQKAVAAVFA